MDGLKSCEIQRGSQQMVVMVQVLITVIQAMVRTFTSIPREAGSFEAKQILLK